MSAKQAGVNSSGQKGSPSASSSGGSGGKSTGSAGTKSDEGALSNVGTQGGKTAADVETGKTTSWGAPEHTNADGITVARSPENWANLQKRVDDTNAAAKDYENRGIFERAMDFFTGPAYNDEEPDFNNPDTFHGGIFHTGTDVPGTLGMLAGMALGPAGSGMVASQVASQVGKWAGVPEAMHNPATEQEQESYNYTGNEGLKAIAEKFAPSAPGKSTASRDSRGTTTTPMSGGMLSDATAPTGEPVATTGNPSVPSNLGQQHSGDPTPSELWGTPGQKGSFIFDNQTGQVRFVAA